MLSAQGTLVHDVGTGWNTFKPPLRQSVWVFQLCRNGWNKGRNAVPIGWAAQLLGLTGCLGSDAAEFTDKCSQTKMIIFFRYIAVTLASLSLLTGCFWLRDYKTECARWYASRAEVLDNLGYDPGTTGNSDNGFNSALPKPRESPLQSKDTSALRIEAQENLYQVDNGFQKLHNIRNVRAFCQHFIKLEDISQYNMNYQQ